MEKEGGEGVKALTDAGAKVKDLVGRRWWVLEKDDTAGDHRNPKEKGAKTNCCASPSV